MYYYISFLRPPPCQVYPSSKTVPITVQITNDLRTELYDGEIDLYISWHHYAQSGPMRAATQFKKLTTWKQSAAYKEIPAPVPSGVHEGQSWRMVITTQVDSLGRRIALNSRTCGSVPFPVYSMPMLFSSKGDKAQFTEKQVSIERVLTISESMASYRVDETISIKEQTSFDLDKKLWDSGIGLGHWTINLCLSTDTETSPQASSISDLRALLVKDESLTVVELGAGTGIASIVIANIRNQIAWLAYVASGYDHDFDLPLDNIISTDLASAMPLLSENIGAKRQDRKSQPDPLVLDWEETELPEPVISVRKNGIDLILMADVTYNTQAFLSLVKTLSSLLLNTAHQTRILLGYKERDPDERSLWGMLANIGIDLEQIGSVPGSGGQPVEIWTATVHSDKIAASNT